MVNLGILYARFVQFGPKLVLVTVAIGTVLVTCTIAIGTEIKLMKMIICILVFLFIFSAVLSF